MNVYSELSNKSKMFHALDFSKIGWPVLPLHFARSDGSCSCGKKPCSSSAKHPLTNSGSKEASVSPMDICQWWNKWPEANIGIATGKASGLIVVDIDPRHGGDKSWAKFAQQNKLEATLRVNTGGGGFHLYFQAPEQPIKNMVNVLPGVDVRGEGGYVLAPPSNHASGHHYEWEVDFDPRLVAPCPDAILSLINRPKVVPAAISSSRVPEGIRNNTLASLAGLLRRHGLTQTGINEALNALNGAVCNPPLDAGEILNIASSISKYESVEEKPTWSMPKPLPEIKTLVPKMTPDLLPKTLRPWAEDICDRMQIPLEFIAAPAMICLSTVIGRQIGIYPKQKDDWFVIPNLWGAVIARPGFFKSPAIAEALKPLEHLVKKERAKYEAAVIVAKSKEDVLKATIDGIKDQVKKAVRKGNQHEIDALQAQLEESLREQKELQVSEKRYKTNDATIEKIGALLLENPDGIMVFRDELSGWLRSLQKSGREGDREFFLEAWNGYGSYTVDRIGRGTLHLPSLCLSIFGGLQPGKLDSYINQAMVGGEGDDGLLQRFQILVYPEATKKWRNIDRKPDEKSQQEVWKLFDALAKINTKNVPPTKGSVPGIRFSRFAQERFNQWRERLENRLRSGEGETPAFESHLSKFRSLVPSLALILHLCDHPSLDVVEVGVENLEKAIKWARLLESHAKKIYSNLIHSELQAAKALAKKIESKAIETGITVRSIYRKGWAHLESSTQVDKALALLEDLGWLQVERIKGATKPREVITLNPNLGVIPLSRNSSTP